MIGSEWKTAVGNALKLANRKAYAEGVIKCVAVRCSRTGVVVHTAVMCLITIAGSI
jgi:hypothetical protein